MVGQPDGGQARHGQPKVGTAHLPDQIQPSPGGGEHQMLFSLTRRQLGTALLALAAVATAGASRAGTLEDVKKKGVVVIGIQGDNAPWGFVDSSGKQDGIDADMGRAFAEYL